jgi:hypothetical protein
MFHKLHLIHPGELHGENHAGNYHYNFFAQNRDQIPKGIVIDRVFPGLSLIFFGDRVERNGNIYAPGLYRAKGLIYCSFADPSGWEEYWVCLDEEGAPVVKYGGQDLSMYYRYVVKK